MNEHTDKVKTYKFNGVIFDPVKHVLTHESGEKSVSLSYTESKILECFLQSSISEIITKEDLLKYAWGGRVVADASVAKTISNLRVTIKQCGVSDDVIITAPRVGYKFAGNIEIDGEQTINEHHLQSSSSTLDTQGISRSCQDQECEKLDYESPITSIVTFLDKTKHKLLNSQVFYYSSFFSTLIFAILGFINALSYINATSGNYYIDPEYEKVTLNKVSLIHKKTTAIPSWVSKIESELQSGDTIFLSESKGFIDIGFHEARSKNGGKNYSFNKKLYNDDFIVNYLTLEIRNEK